VRRTTSRRVAALLLAAPLSLAAAGADEPPAGTVPQATPAPQSGPEPPSQPAPEAGPSQEQIAIFERAGRLLQARCAMPGCHLGPDGMKGMRLESGQIYRSTVNVRSRTEPGLLRVAPGAPDRSLLYLKLLPPEEGHYRGPRMPMAMNPLAPEEIALVRQWIESFPAELWGAPPAAEPAAGAARTFQGSTLVNLPTPDPLGARALEFQILHRFKTSTRDSGSKDFYGLDSGAWISIGLAYGLTDTLEVGLRRTNLEHDYEADAKWTPLRQVAGASPVSLALRASYSNLRETGAFNRDRAGAQAILARRFGKRLSLMLVPTYVSHANFLDRGDHRGSTAVGAGGELRVTSKMAITGEWVAQTSGVESTNQSGSVGLSVATARHVFHVFATNTAGIHTDQYAPGGDLDFGSGYFRLGFNITRTYTLHQ